MALIVEDGSIVTGAQSYVSADDVIAYCAARGLEMSTDTSTVEQYILRAMDYFESLYGSFKGTRVSSGQPLQWPREDVYVYDDDEPLDETEIPTGIENALCRLAYDVSIQDVLPTGTGREVASEAVGVISTSYFQSNMGSLIPQLNQFNAILSPYIETGGSGITVSRA